MTTSLTSTGITFNDATTLATGTPSIPSGSNVVFQQTSAPTGWTKITLYNDVGLRIVNGTIGTKTSGTAWSTGLAQTVVGSTTLSICQTPSHNHQLYAYVGMAGSVGCGCAHLAIDGTWPTNAGQGVYGCWSSNSKGGGGSHNHTVSLNLNYIDLILAQKN